MRLFYAVIFIFCTFFILPTCAFADNLQDVQIKASEYKTILLKDYQSKRKAKKIQADIAHEFSQRHPNQTHIIELRKEYIANGNSKTTDWLNLMNYISQQKKYNYHLPDSPNFWNPEQNEILLIGMNALIVAKSKDEKTTSYTALLNNLETINSHVQAGKGGYRLFWFETELAKSILQDITVDLDDLARERMASINLLMTQKILKVEEKTAGQKPQLCFDFRLPLKLHGVKYLDYLRIEPLTKITAVAQQDKKLCLRGLDYATDYNVTVLSGVPTSLSSAHDMAEDYKVKINLGDRKPSMRFKSGKYIVSKNVLSGIPLETVNINKVKIRIAKAMTERALPNTANIMDRDLHQYTFNNYFKTTGEPIWSGEMDIQTTQNRNITTYFPVEDVIKKPDPGIYAISAEFEKDNKTKLTTQQFFIITDIGLTSLTAENGLHVFARSLKTAQPLSGIDVSLISKNNTVLATGKTDKNGMHRFPKAVGKGRAGLTPMLVTAKAVADFALIRLEKPAYDLSDRGVAGRYYPSAIDSFVYSDRGVYRPSENVNIVAIMRDNKGYALPDVPATIRVRRPDGIVHFEKTFIKTDLGGIHLNMTLPPNARTGTWHINVYADPDAPATGTVSFRVEEYVPPKIEVGLTTKHETLWADKNSYDFALRGDYFYGAPAAELKTFAEAIVLQDNTPFKQYKDFHFGLAQEKFTPKTFPLVSPKTDTEGKSTINVTIDPDKLLDISLPLKLRVRASIFEKGGRSVSAVLDKPLRHKQVYLGLRQVKDASTVGYKKPKKFEVIALDNKGNRLSLDGVEYKLVYEKHYYNWYQYRHQGWRYEHQYFDELISKNVVSITSDKPMIIETEINHNYWWGRHRLELIHPQTGAVVSLRLKNYWGDPEQDTPDTVKVSTKSEQVEIGKKVEIQIKPPYAGQAMIVIANNEVLDVQYAKIPEEGKSIFVDVKKNWGPGAYVMVSLFRPTTHLAQQQGGVRAVGLKWLSVNHKDEKLSVSFDVPDKVLPRQKFQLPFQISGLSKGEKAFITVSAVDEGILQLTDFRTPNPFDFYFGQRRLGVYLRDIYGKLISGGEGAIGKIRVGGGAMRQSKSDVAFKPETYIKSVALFSGLVTVGDSGNGNGNGNGEITLELPDFNGRLRLMAVAYSAKKIGQGEDKLIVRDPVIIDGSLPRFLAPEDKTELNIRIQNMDGIKGEYHISLETSGTIISPNVVKQTVTLSKGEEKTFRFPLVALAEVGKAKALITVTGPDNFKVIKNWEFDVRPYQIMNTRNLKGKIAPESTYEFGDLIDEYWPGTITASATLSPEKDLNVKALLTGLNRYPYGCTEQLVSTATPLLYLDKLHKKWGIRLKDDIDLIKIRAQASVDRVAGNMSSNGSFGYWYWNDASHLWLSAYATEFLLHAHKAGYNVSETSLKKATEHLKSKISSIGYNDKEKSAVAYALYVLTKANMIDVGQVRYFYDQTKDSLRVNWALGMLGSSLNHFGETERAKEAFEKALNITKKDSSYTYWYYGTRLRNQAVLMSLLAENRDLSLRTEGLLDELLESYDGKKHLSTQEMLWLIRAALNLTPLQSKEIRFHLEQRHDTVVTDKSYSFDLTDNASSLPNEQVTNIGESMIFARLNLLASPRQTLPAEEKGFQVSRSYYTMDGEPALEDGTVKQNTLLAVIVEGNIGGVRYRSHENLLVAMLPAGFELENADLSGGKGSGELGWLVQDKSITKLVHKELRDDRFVASWRSDENKYNRYWNSNKYKQDFKIVYFVRAISPGVYAHPGAYVEDMYHPGVYGRGAAGTIEIVGNDE